MGAIRPRHNLDGPAVYAWEPTGWLGTWATKTLRVNPQINYFPLSINGPGFSITVNAQFGQRKRLISLISSKSMKEKYLVIQRHPSKLKKLRLRILCKRQSIIVPTLSVCSETFKTLQKHYQG